MTAATIPSPPGLPLLGHLLEMNRDMPGFLDRTARELGGLSRLRMGPMSMILVADPQLVHEMLVKRPQDFAKSWRTTRLLQGHVGDGLLTREGTEHRRHRRIMLPTLHTQRIARYGEIMTAEARRLLDGWPDGARIDVVEEMTQLTLRIVGASLFTVDDDGDEVFAAVHDFVDSLNAYLLSFGILPTWLPTRTHRWRRASVARMDTIAYDLIRRRRESGADSADLLSMLINAKDAEGGPQLTDAEIRDELLTMFFAGHETSATALTWACYELARHPEIADRLRAELVEVLGDREPTMADLGRLPYLDQVVKETLRRWAPVFLLDRSPVAPTELGGYAVKPGDILFFSPYVVHLDPEYWPEPHEFRPERFADGAQPGREAFLPFGDGPRLCVGNRFAEAEIALVLATLVPRVRLELPAGHTLKLQGQATIRPAGGLPMTVRR
ncbi:cytochrome P450 [Catellatospora tritici]|uniref:cytochrome P450 n=1 Tax=Catellatospora tritici TaxID=2851566 RepID=UPI001C2D7C48|nr:cytochrome P450 [Catellatospora tritici]MBV1849196.1 cytochrome P450 [Catellatospora tritici]